MKPDDLVKLPLEEIESLVQTYCDEQRQKNSPGSANQTLALLKTFFACNGFNHENHKELKVKGYYQPPRTNTKEYVPTLKEALLMADRVGNKEYRALILTACTAGLRNSALRALKVDDVLDDLRSGRIPILVEIDEEWNKRIPEGGACKGCIPYYTFIAKPAAQALTAMLEEREATFGSYSRDEPLFISNYNQIRQQDRRKRHLSARELEIMVHKAAKLADIPEWSHVRVHSLRKVFDGVLRTSLSDGTQMDHKDQEFLMGHVLKGSQEHYYDRSKVERLSDQYSKLVFEDKSMLHDVELEVTSQLAEMLGLDLSNIMSEKEIASGRKLSRNERLELLKQALNSKLEFDTDERRSADLKEVDGLLQDGWKVESTLPDSRVIVSRRRRKVG
jgi:integrase